jgi:hypothetical protein
MLYYDARNTMDYTLKYNLADPLSCYIVFPGVQFLESGDVRLSELADRYLALVEEIHLDDSCERVSVSVAIGVGICLLRPLVSGITKKATTMQSAVEPTKMRAVEAPRLAASGVYKYGVNKLYAQLRTKLTVMAKDCVFARRRRDEISFIKV